MFKKERQKVSTDICQKKKRKQKKSIQKTGKKK